MKIVENNISDDTGESRWEEKETIDYQFACLMINRNT